MPYDPKTMPMERTAWPSRERRKPFVAFDFETSPIPRTATERMRVDLKYLTAFSDGYGVNRPMRVSESVSTHLALARLLEERFFTRRREHTRYIAWNANRFDYRPIVEAIVEHMPEYIAMPYTANAGGLRGLRIARRGTSLAWEILDGIAITGCAGWSLRKFLAVFAPDMQKHDLDLGSTIFDPSNPDHVAYAQRDSEGLYRAMCRVDTILRDLTGRGIGVTIGNVGIRFFQTQLPQEVRVWKPAARALDALRRYAIRGGFTFTARQYYGPLWTYDRNQEYAHIMRSQRLPCGRCYETREELSDVLGMYFCTISYPGGAPIPFYCAAIDEAGRGDKRAVDGSVPVSTCILSNEIDMLRGFGWSVEVRQGWYWDDTFSMREMVDSLEEIRTTCDGGPKGAIGTMVKALGNHSFGKTLEQTHPERIVLSREDPSDEETQYGPWRPAHGAVDPITGEDDIAHAYYWFTVEDDDAGAKLYHRPHIGAFITAGARCDMYSLAMSDPEAFVKCDTDSVAFSRPVQGLEEQIHETRYGAMKKETDGDVVIVLGKKAYFNTRTQEAHCKGLSVSRLTQEDFERWFHEAIPPTQEQIQTLSFKRGIGQDSKQYRHQVRRGTDFASTAPKTLSRGKR